MIDNSVCTVVDGECGNASSQAASIIGAAFAGASGAIAVNGAAGAENQQANLASFGIGIGNGSNDGIGGRVTSLTLLSQVRASTRTGGRSGRTGCGEDCGHQFASLH